MATREGSNASSSVKAIKNSNNSAGMSVLGAMINRHWAICIVAMPPINIGFIFLYFSAIIINGSATRNDIIKIMTYKIICVCEVSDN